MIKKVLLFIGLTLALVVAVLAGNLIILNKTSERVTAGAPIPEYGADRSALLIIDVQEATTGSVGLNPAYQEQAGTLIPVLNTLAYRADSTGIPVIYVTSVVTNPLINLLNNSMAKGSRGTEIDQRLIRPSSSLIEKKRGDAFFKTGLDSLLLELKVNHLYITGLDAAHCVNCTLRAALNRGYRISVVEDAVISAPVEKKQEMMVQFRQLGAAIIPLDPFPDPNASNQK
jgi:nicotinamidase/pyrazinamidase